MPLAAASRPDSMRTPSRTTASRVPPGEYGGSTERQFDRARSHDAYARTAAQMWRSPKDAISASREMAADMVQPAPDASSGIAFDSVAVELRSETREDLDMLEQIG